jgi:GNAT superfamily N-acetyltransferase
MNSTIIRKLRAEDEPRWRVLWAGYVRFYRGNVSPEVTASVWQKILDDTGDTRGLIAERNGEVIGLVHYVYHATTWSLASHCYLGDLFVDQDARGSGAARALIDGVLDAAKAHGASRVYWHTQEYNSAARSLYDTVTPRSSFIVYRKELN